MVQMLFPGVGKEYFILNPSLTGCPSKSPFSVLVSSLLSSLLPLEQEVPVEGREIPLFHRVTQWWDMLGSMVDSRDSRRLVITLAAVPTQHEAGLGKILGLCHQYLTHAQEAAQKAGHVV